MTDVQPPDCWVRARLVEAEVDLIRRELGRPADRRPRPTVTGALPRECWFAALALFRKADALRRELGGEPGAAVPLAPPAPQLRPGHVRELLDAALANLRVVKTRLGIDQPGSEPAIDDAKTPSDVYAAVVAADRNLNLLLERPVTPGDVYQLISLSMAYTRRLLAKYGVAAPAAAPASRHKRPGDVYQRLLGCLDRLRAIATAAGQQVIDTPVARGDADDVLPSDCYDLASLVLGETVFVHAHVGDAAAPQPFEADAPGRRLPSDCDQLAHTLETNLAELAKHVR